MPNLGGHEFVQHTILPTLAVPPGKVGDQPFRGLFLTPLINRYGLQVDTLPTKLKMAEMS